MLMEIQHFYGDSAQLGKILRKVLLTKQEKQPLNPNNKKHQVGYALIGLLSNTASTSGHRFLILPMLNLECLSLWCPE